MDKLRLKRASKDDVTLLFDWVNEPVMRKFSLNSEPIQWEDHSLWYEKKLLNEKCDLFLGIDKNNNKVGMVRFDNSENSSVISVNVDKKFRDLGYGTELIRSGSKRIFAERKVNSIKAVIKTENIASIKSFEKVGYRFFRKAKAGMVDVMEMVLTTENIIE